MAIEGPLKELGIHDVFQLLDLSRKTGVLRVTSKLRHNQGTVYFEGGSVVYASIQTNPHPLGALLLHSGKVTDGDVSRAREMQQQGDQRRLGDILVSIGAVTERDLQRFVRQQIEEVVFEVMSWQEGYFSFTEGPLPTAASEAAVRLPTEAVLMEGARRIDEWSRIEGKIPHLGVIPALAPLSETEHGTLDLLPAEWQVLAAIDGQRTVRELASLVGRAEFDVAKTVFGLSTAGVVTLTDRARPGGQPGELAQNAGQLARRAAAALEQGDLEAARTAAHAAMAVQPHDAALHLLLGRIALAEGDDPEAEAHLRHALRLDVMLAEAQRLLGDALGRQGRFAEAVEWWQRWLRLGDATADLEPRVQAVQQAVRAAQTLDLLLRGSHG